MADLSKFRSLSPELQSIVAFAVLLDGLDSVEYLLQDKEKGVLLSKTAAELIKLPLEIRLPYCGTCLRESLNKIK
ncbi:MAG: hypothetical protein KBC84_07550 [Proteobacteria bacterium]|nr:hypothetical protein [Pseudomonadota bacterium]